MSHPPLLLPLRCLLLLLLLLLLRSLFALVAVLLFVLSKMQRISTNPTDSRSAAVVALATSGTFVDGVAGDGTAWTHRATARRPHRDRHGVHLRRA